MAMNSISQADKVKGARLRPGTARRVMGYARTARLRIVVFLAVTLVDSVLLLATPLLLKRILDDGVAKEDTGLIVRLALVVALVAIVNACLAVLLRWMSSRVGEGLIFELRREVFGHVLRQPIAFFTRTQTGSLVTRLNSDVVGAQQAFTSVLANVVSNVLSLAIVVGMMLALSWQLTLLALMIVPIVLLPTRRMGRRLAALSRLQMEQNADLGSRMSERFNVSGALLVKLYGRPRQEDVEYAERAARVRDAGISIALNRGIFMAGLTLMASLATAVLYGAGGVLVVQGTLTLGTLVAMALLVARLYGPLTTLSNARVDVMTAFVSFERVFEVLDLKPSVPEPAAAKDLPDGALGLRLKGVEFNYPAADAVSLQSLEGDVTGDRGASETVLQDIDVEIKPGQLVALVGPSGAGKTTLTGLMARLYDPTEGSVSLGGVDVRDVSSDDLRDRLGVVSQDAHLFHDTIRANLLYAAPDADDRDVEKALRSAQVWDLIERLPEGLDTVVGDRGHRLSGGEKQRLAIARLLLKAPSVVILDEATAHLDSESEAAVQRALDSALRDRTSVVIAHRLSTVRDADQILVMDQGRVVERGDHRSLLARGGLYSDLYRTQFRDATPGVDQAAG
ncbi:ABC transporter ATP-binding protein [Demetria terragena]|uniref:ABC transporter ATP-binding protein n=1 Tax=Demetria terragena TaxID=63959 RepID=UPI001FDF8408|nr:ABC transporter ATP-binding protein [Demetria terragena]